MTSSSIVTVKKQQQISLSLSINLNRLWMINMSSLSFLPTSSVVIKSDNNPLLLLSPFYRIITSSASIDKLPLLFVE